MEHDFLHLMAIMIILATPYNKSIESALDFHAKAIHSAHCPWCDCISLEEKLVHKSKLEANMSCQKQHVHEACMACMYEKQWVLSQKHWVLKWNLSRWHAKSTGC